MFPVGGGHAAAMSCLPQDALSHFEQREQELLALDQALEEKRAKVLDEAASAVRQAEAGAASLPSRILRLQEEQPEVCGVLAASGQLGQSGSLGPGLPTASLQRPLSASHDGGDALHATIRFQNARIVALQEELDKTIRELGDREGELQTVRQDAKQASEEVKRQQKAAAASEQLQEKLKKQLSSLETRVKDLEQERSELLKAKDGQDLKIRKLEAEVSSKEARLSRATEDLERQKLLVKDSTAQDRDRAAAERREQERLGNEVRKLERQRTELVNAFKKQMRLIEVLKRQRAHMEAARVLSFTEEEFIRILELGERLGE